MLYLHGDHLLSGPAFIGAPWFQLDGKYLRKGPDGEILAEHVNNTWCIGGNCHSSLAFISRACIHFDVQTAEGPFEDVRLVDGYIHVNDRIFGRLLADPWRWHCYTRAEPWTKLTIKPPVSKIHQSETTSEAEA